MVPESPGSPYRVDDRVDDPVQRWFDGRAEGYGAASARWPWSAVRRAEAASVLRAVGPVAGRSALELGSGVGFYSALLLREGAARVVAVDRSPAMVSRLPAGVSGVVADAARLQLGQRFERIVCLGMLEFVDDPEAVFRAAAAHAAEGATLTVMAPGRSVGAAAYAAWNAARGLSIQRYGRERLEALGAATGWALRDLEAVPPFNDVGSFVIRAG